MPRLFTALEIPRDAALSLSLLRGGLPGARWIDVENYHLTLRFIGDIEGHLADEIAHALDRVRRPAFDLTLSGVGAFGSKKPHSIYAGVIPSPELNALQGEIDRICTRAGAPSDQRKFVPHVTLARLRNSSPGEVASYLSARGNFLTFELDDAEDVHRRIKEAGVYVDRRDRRIRFGFGVYHDADSVAALLEALRKALG